MTTEKDGELCWTEEARRLGKRLVASVVGIDDALRLAVNRTPAPNWTSASSYRMVEEAKLDAKILECNTAMAKLKAEKTELEERLNEAGRLRDLLFEQGKPLETAVIATMKLFGFEAEPFDEGESEFDVVFYCPEGRCLGEAEGKDNKAINIQKFRQLEQNIQEDFERDDVAEHAKGVLFGNAFRLDPPEKRADFFTDKCYAAAKRTGAALVRTIDLFEPARYVMENPSDEAYAKECRDAILAAKGTVTVFPKTPIKSETSVVSGDERKDPMPTLKVAN